MVMAIARRTLLLVGPTVLLVACGSASNGAAPALSSSSTSAGSPSSTPAAASSAATGRVVELGTDGEVELQRNGERVTVVCNGDGDIDIEADDVVVTATGSCGKISVDGRANTVTIASAVSLEVDGVGSRITGARIATVDVDGSKHVVNVSDVEREIRVQGTGHKVRYGGTPRTDFHQDDSDVSGQDESADDDQSGSDATGQDGTNDSDDGNDTETGSDP